MRLSKKIFLILFCLLIGVSAVYAEGKPALTGQGYVQDYAWLNPVEEEGLIGTVGISKNLEAFKLNISEGTIHYTSHVSTIGWQDEKTNDQMSGTNEQNLPIEAIKISLDSDLSSRYNIVYRVHCADIGWLDWTENGNAAGTIGLALPVQAIQVKLVPVDQAQENTEGVSYFTNYDINQFDSVTYQCHCSYLGWQDNVENGATAGTLGESRPIEGIKIDAPNIEDFDPNSHLEYTTHVAYYGWQTPVTETELSGTEGQGLNIQAIKINLTGKIAAVCDVYYRTHVSNIGWLGWSKDGQESGTVGFGLPIEAIEIKILPKNSEKPGSTENSFFTSESNYSVIAQSEVENLGWLDPVDASNDVGTEGRGLGIEALILSVPNINGDSGIAYNLFIEDIGWQGEHYTGETAGTVGENKQVEAVQMHLTGTIAQLYDIYYCAHCQDQGWLGWTSNDGIAGTAKGNKKLESLCIKLVPKSDINNRPVSSIEAFREIEIIKEPPKLTEGDIPNFNFICAVVQHEGGANYEGALAVISCVMNRCDSGRWGGTDPVSVLTAPGQFASYLSGAYLQFMNNPSPVVKQAVLDCFNGTRSHPYQSFRSYATSGSVCIGGNWFF